MLLVTISTLPGINMRIIIWYSIDRQAVVETLLSFPFHPICNALTIANSNYGSKQILIFS